MNTQQEVSTPAIHTIVKLFYCSLSIVWLVVLLVSTATGALGQTIVNVNANQTLGEADLLAGSFQGASFTLNPSTTFEINDGGLVGPVGGSLNFGNSVVNFNNGSRLHTQVNVTDAVLNVLGGEISRDTTLNSGVTLNVYDGAEIGRRLIANSDSTVNIFGGETDFALAEPFLARAGSEVNIAGGIVGTLQPQGADVNMSGGHIGSLSIRVGSAVDISSGSVGGLSVSGATVDISGGNIDGFHANSASIVNITGGVFGSSFDADTNSNVNIFGGELLLNGVPFLGTTINLSDTDILSGTLTDGSPFIFSPLSFFAGDNLSGVTFVSSSLPTRDLTPIVVNANNNDGPAGLRSGQTLILEDGGVLGDNFAVVNADLTITGGSVGSGLEIAYSNINISGGTVSGGSEIYSGSTVNITGGTVGGLRAYAGGEVNLFGTEFVFDGVPLDTLTPGEAYAIPVGTFSSLSGRLADGNEFSYSISDSVSSISKVFSPGSTLTVTLIPEPRSLTLLGITGLMLFRSRCFLEIGVP